MNKQKFLDKITDLVEETLVENHASSDFTIEDLLEDEDRCAIRLTYDYSDAEYTKNVDDLFRRKKEEDVKVKDLYRNSDIADEVKDFVEEQRRLRAERLENEPDYYAEDYDLDSDDEYDDEEDYDDDYDEDEDEYDDEDDDYDVDDEMDELFEDESEDEKEPFEKIYALVTVAEDGTLGYKTVDESGNEVDGNPTIPKPQVKSLAGIISAALEIGVEEDLGMFVLNAKDECYGASAILDERAAEMVREALSSSKVIFIPSSVHEWIVTPLPELDEEKVRDMEEIISQVNSTLRPGEFLSNTAYVGDVSGENVKLTPVRDYIKDKGADEVANEVKDIPFC